MKLKKDYVLRQVANTWVVLPLGTADAAFDGMMKLNHSGAFLWQQMEQGKDFGALVDALTMEYEVSREQAEADVKEFLAKLIKAGCVQE